MKEASKLVLKAIVAAIIVTIIGIVVAYPSFYNEPSANLFQSLAILVMAPGSMLALPIYDLLSPTSRAFETLFFCAASLIANGMIGGLIGTVITEVRRRHTKQKMT